MIGKVVSGVFGVLFVIYLGYVFIASPPCERVYRSAVPVRLFMTTLRAAYENWGDASGRLKLLEWSFEMDAGTQRFIARQFYGDLKCREGR